MMVPPRPSQWSQQHETAEVVTPQHDTHSSGLSLLAALFEGGVRVKTKLTARCLSPTIITSQHNITTLLRLHFQEGIREDGGREEEEEDQSLISSQLGKVLGLPTHLKEGIL